MGIYEPYDKLVYQVAGRALFRPDLTTAGHPYIVTATIGTLTNGTTNVTFTVNAGTYLGAGFCTYCHGSSAPADTAKVPFWQNTAHASIFTHGIDGDLGSHTAQSCLKCHTVGYDTNAISLADGGFYATAQAEGWTFPDGPDQQQLGVHAGELSGRGQPGQHSMRELPRAGQRTCVCLRQYQRSRLAEARGHRQFGRLQPMP